MISAIIMGVLVAIMGSTNDPATYLFISVVVSFLCGIIMYHSAKALWFCSKEDEDQDLEDLCAILNESPDGVSALKILYVVNFLTTLVECIVIAYVLIGLGDMNVGINLIITFLVLRTMLIDKRMKRLD